MSDGSGKIVFLGLNKCGTTSLHRMLTASGIASVHWRVPKGPFLAKALMTNLATGRRAFEGFEHFDAFSDITFIDGTLYIEGARLFREIHACYPAAKYVLNTRDCEAWLRSRSAHHRGGSGPSILDRVTAATGEPEARILQGWRDVFAAHHAQVRAHFDGHPRFMEFDIQTGDAAALAAFLAPEHRVDPGAWGQHNKMKPAPA